MVATSVIQLYKRLSKCTVSQLKYIARNMGLQKRFIDDAAVQAAFADQIMELLQQRPAEQWTAKLEREINDAQSSTEDYLGGRLAHLRNFLLQSPLVSGAPVESVGTIKDLREKLKEASDKSLDKPVLIRVRGTLFKAALLTAGWWERKQQEPGGLKVKWESDLQQWLFEGFDLWAPSWDICWGARDPKDKSKRYYIAQLTEGDEADSLPVIIGPEKAKVLEGYFAKWGGFEVMIEGRLGHRFQFGKKLPKNEKRTPQDYYISVDDEDKRQKITPLRASTALYSGYLWKLLVPEEHFRKQEMLRLEHVYFVWEHTNFAAREAVDYNLEALAHKEEIIARRHRGSKLVLLQKSHDLIVPGKPQWSVDQFHDFYLGQARAI